MDNREAIEKLKKKLKFQKTKVKRLETLLIISEKLWMVSEFSEGKKYAQLALELSKNIENKKGEAASYYILGLTSSYLNDYDTAIEFLYKCLKINRELKDHSKIAESLNNLGQIYINLKEFKNARSCFEEALEHKPNYGRTLNNLCHIAQEFEEYEKALDYGFKAFKAADEVYKSDRIDKGCSRSRIFALINLSEIYQKIPDYNKSLKYAKKALKLSEGREDDTFLIANINISKIYIQIDDFDKALDYIEISEKLAENHENKEFIKEIFSLYSELYEKKSEYKLALDYYKKSVQLERTFYDEEMRDKIAKLQALYEVENKELRAQKMAEKASRLASLGVMAGGLTHEINQPLCAIKVSADSILYWCKKNSLTLPDDFKEGLENISEAANHIDKIIQHMRSFWKTPDKTELEVIDLNSVIKKALGLIERQLYSHGIFLELDLADENLLISAKGIHLEQIVINIVVNAMHALDEMDKTDKRIIISTKKGDDKIILMIEDNGTGLPNDIGEKIYDPFFSTKKPGKGMGLGLNKTKNYVEKYKAEIKAVNAKNGGAVFKIGFPTYEEK